MSLESMQIVIRARIDTHRPHSNVCPVRRVIKTVAEPVAKP